MRKFTYIVETFDHIWEIQAGSEKETEQIAMSRLVGDDCLLSIRLKSIFA